MFKTFTLSFLLVALSYQACGLGCLKCNSQTNNCVICDIANFYYLSNTTCVAITARNNCAVFRLNGACFACNSGFYLDANTNRCVAVPATKVVAQCRTYDANQNCVACASGFYISSANCTAVNTTVANCNFYSANGVCSVCNAGFIFNVDSTACVAPPAIQGCGSYTYLSCGSCGSGYINNANNYLSIFNSSTTYIENLYLNRATNTTSSAPTNLAVCQQIAIQNCLVYLSATQCATCAPGFYLSAARQCVSFPIAVIDGCLVYTSNSACATCIAGRHLADNTGASCVADVAITNCVTYNGAAIGTTTCTACSIPTYLSSNTCVARTASLNLANCATYQISADRCATCVPNYQITASDGLKCLAAIANCAVYDTSITSASPNQLCTTCASGSYISTDRLTCTPGAITGCLTYSSQTVCAACNPSGYYLSGNTCVAVSPIARCTVYDATNVNTCATCQPGYYPFLLANTCQTTPVIANCLRGASALSGGVAVCAICNPGYYVTGATCTQNPVGFENCSLYSPTATSVSGATGACLLCSGTNVLSVTGRCVSPYGFLTANCQNITIATASLNAAGQSSLSLFAIGTATTVDPTQFTCAVCNQGSVPFNYVNSYVCLEQSRLPDIGAVAVTSCLRYEVTGTAAATPAVICAECIPGYFLSAANVCTAYTSSVTAPCASGSYLLVDNLVDGIVNICLAANGANTYAGCAVAGRADISVYTASTPFANSATLETADLRCMRTAASVASGVATPTSVFALGATITALDTILNPYPAIDVNTPITLTIKPVLHYLRYAFTLATPPTGSALVAGCEVYNSALTVCAKCKFGFALDNGGSGTAGSCVNAVSGCNTAIFLGGLQGPINAFASCHICTNTAQVVRVNLLINAASPYTLNPITTFTTTPTVACVATTALSSVTLVPANCAVVFVDQTTGGTPAQPYCAACKPGYAATPAPAATAYPFQVTACNAITSCDLTDPKTPFNGCSSCISTAAAPTAIDENTHSACVALTTAGPATTNCLYGLTTATVFTCTLCRPGFYLNADKVCETYSLTSCGDTTFTQAISDVIPNNAAVNAATTFAYRSHYLTLLSWNVWPLGCRQCSNFASTTSTPFVGVKFARNNPLTGCIASNYIGATISVTATNYVNNCRQYVDSINAAGATTCFACNTGYILTTDARRCVANINNCLVAANIALASTATTTNCATCAPGYALNAAFACVAISISNCSVATFTGSAQTCTTCASGYSLATGGASCVLGSVANCASYNAPSLVSCANCAANFTVVAVSGGSYCLPIDTSLNCLTFDNGSNSGLNIRSYNCLTCVNTATAAFVLRAAPSAATDVRSICQPLYTVNNCATYSSSAANSLSTTTLGCTACASGFYLSNAFSCVARTALSANCLVPNPSADNCQTCNPGFFLNAANNLCVAYPSGIVGCATYTNATVCATCTAPRYLSNNACLLSPVIASCAVYSANNTCAACSSGYFLTNSTLCQVATVQNCAVYQAIDSCSVCNPGFGIQAAASTNGASTTGNTCVSNSLPNCAVSTTTSPFTCSFCNSGYYLSQGSCVAITSAIANCAAYDSATTCSQCSAPYVLTVNKTVCTQAYQLQTDVNCASTLVSATATCSQCALGSYFVNGTCTTCANSASGCLSCDPNNSTACYACRTNYYQVANGSCIASGQVTTTPTTPTNPNTPTSSASIISIFVAMLLVWFF